MKSLFASLLTTAALVWAANAETVRLVLPQETATLKKGEGMELAASNCLTCHSAEYISTQPVLARTAWKASVDKMKAKFGAPIPDDAVEKLTNYLTTAYGKPDPVK